MLNTSSLHENHGNHIHIRPYCIWRFWDSQWRKLGWRNSWALSSNSGLLGPKKEDEKKKKEEEKKIEEEEKKKKEEEKKKKEEEKKKEGEKKKEEKK